MDDFSLLIEIVEFEGASMESEKMRNNVNKAEPSDSDETDRSSTAQSNAAAEAEAGEPDSDQRREVAKHYKEMVERGANIKGEGEIE